MGDAKIHDYYSSVCRTCLQSSSGEMQNLTAFINGNVVHQDEAKISYLDCLQYCLPATITEAGAATESSSLDLDLETFPQMICIDCASALQVAYWFMKNASKAQEVLKIRLKELREKQKQMERQVSNCCIVNGWWREMGNARI